MKKIKFDKNNIISMYTTGMESIIYYYRCGLDIVFLKYFKKELQFSNHKKIVNNETLNNKRRKIELIPEIKEFRDEIQILDLVYDENDNFIGYTMKIDELKTANKISNKKLKIEILKQLKQKVEMFNENDIYIGDFNPKNIVITDNGIKLCDLDNFRIDELDFDLKSNHQQLYLEKCKNIKNIDNFSFNLFTISYIGNIYGPYLLDYIYKNRLPRKLNTKQNRVIIEELIHINDNYQKKYLIDNIRKIA